MTLSKKKIKQYVCIDYHYIRPDLNTSFPGIIGHTEAQFREHLDALREKFHILTPKEAILFSRTDWEWDNDKEGLLMTFDDGTSDHFSVSKILDEYKIKGLFFVPSCIYEGEPINPTIIHFCIEHFRISGFLKVYNRLLQELPDSMKRLSISYKSGDNPWKAIATIKDTFKYHIPHKIGRDILLSIYRELFEKTFKDALALIHLTKEQTSDMVSRGHSLGVHTHTHISINDNNLSKQEIIAEMITPKHKLEKLFDIDIQTFSYPYGEEKDRMSHEELLKKTKEYDLVFTADFFFPGPNTKNTSSFELGRYAVSPRDDAKTLLKKLSMS